MKIHHRPESLGIVVAVVFLMVTIHEQLFFAYSFDKLVEYNAGLLSICLVSLLGFMDDIVDLKWRHKLIVSCIGTYPLLVAYKGLTSVIVPVFVRDLIGESRVELSFLYYVYMGMLGIFTTNSINIYAGINGLEVGQSFVIGVFILVHNIIVRSSSFSSFSTISSRFLPKKS